MNLQVIFEQVCLRWSDRVCIIDGDVSLTYGELYDAARRSAATLKAKSGKAAPRVALLLGNRWEYLVLDMACAFGGCILVRTNARDSAGDLAHLLADSGADIFVFGGELAATATAALERIDRTRISCIELPAMDSSGRREALADLFLAAEPAAAEQLLPSSIYKFMYTSGTTGKPKGVVVTHDQWICAVLQNLFLGPLHDVGWDECFLHVTPLTHVSGGLFWAFMLRGARHVIGSDSSLPTLAREIERCGVTRTFLVPTLVSRLVGATPQEQESFRKLHRIYYAASPIGVQTLRAAVDLFGPIFAQGYGSTEAMWWMTYFYPHEHEAALRVNDIERLASCGRPSLGVEMLVVDDHGKPVPVGEVGEVATRGRHVADNYLNVGPVPRDARIGEGWFRTGDMGVFDTEGFLYLVDRKNNLIISGGFNVYPGEVESSLLQHPGVAECCVVGAPDEQWGEVVVALIVKAKDAILDEEELLAFARREITDYKRPRRVQFLPEMPINAGGKIDRRQLRDRLWSAQGRKI